MSATRSRRTTSGSPWRSTPQFATWNAYRNNDWPALYFIDRSGEIRHIAAGEGGYDTSEQVIRELLSGA